MQDTIEKSRVPDTIEKSRAQDTIEKSRVCNLTLSVVLGAIPWLQRYLAGPVKTRRERAGSQRYFLFLLLPPLRPCLSVTSPVGMVLMLLSAALLHSSSLSSSGIVDPESASPSFFSSCNVITMPHPRLRMKMSGPKQFSVSEGSGEV